MCICKYVLDVYEITTLGGTRQPQHPMDSHRRGYGDRRPNLHHWGSMGSQVGKLSHTQNSGLVDHTEPTLPHSQQSFPMLFPRLWFSCKWQCRKCPINKENPEDGKLLEKLPLTDLAFGGQPQRISLDELERTFDNHHAIRIDKLLPHRWMFVFCWRSVVLDSLQIGKAKGFVITRLLHHRGRKGSFKMS